MLRRPSFQNLVSWSAGNPVFSQVIIALVINVAAAVLLLVFERFRLETAFAMVLCVLLAVVLVQTQVAMSKLTYMVSSSLDHSAGDPKTVLLDDVFRSLRRYGYLHSSEHESTLRSKLSTAIYIRGEQFYRLLKTGIPTCKERLLTVNDHPFTPFAELVRQKKPSGIEDVAISSIPDSLYSREDIAERVSIITGGGTEYYLLPDEDVHMSMLIFDNNAVLVYTEPPGRGVCNFSEALLFRNNDAVEELVQVYRHIQKLAKYWQKKHQFSPLAALQAFHQFSPV
ncbi:MAG: hypothetical protein ABSH35_35070 [Isosphaeraceae bacterium]|jgi:hypothetical protein